MTICDSLKEHAEQLLKESDQKVVLRYKEIKELIRTQAHPNLIRGCYRNIQECKEIMRRCKILLDKHIYMIDPDTKRTYELQDVCEKNVGWVQQVDIINPGYIKVHELGGPVVRQRVMVSLHDPFDLDVPMFGTYYGPDRTMLEVISLYEYFE